MGYFAKHDFLITKILLWLLLGNICSKLDYICYSTIWSHCSRATTLEMNLNPLIADKNDINKLYFLLYSKRPEQAQNIILKCQL